MSFLEAVTGIEKLIPDPYLKGGGLHLSGPGGVLVPHTDFHNYGELDLYRQLNVLVYLNPGWDESWGGCLELFEDRQAERASSKIVPTWGTCVIFRTDDLSVHGFPVPIAPGHWRRSIALYYYTARENSTFSGDSTTVLATSWRVAGHTQQSCGWRAIEH